jgi:hypothetical protein
VVAAVQAVGLAEDLDEPVRLHRELAQQLPQLAVRVPLPHRHTSPRRSLDRSDVAATAANSCGSMIEIFDE